MNSDGIGCITCHTQEAPPAELAGFGPLPVAKQAANNFGIQYGPLFTDPDPVPVPKHGMNSGTDDWWTATVGNSQLCGACHNVKVDIDGDGLSPVTDDNTSTTDADGNFTLDQNELDDADGTLDDLVLQTTFDEWQDYVAGFEARVKDDPRNTLEAPLGCTDCHMPTAVDGEQPVVDFAPGFLSEARPHLPLAHVRRRRLRPRHRALHAVRLPRQRAAEGARRSPGAARVRGHPRGRRQGRERRPARTCSQSSCRTTCSGTTSRPGSPSLASSGSR